MVPTLFLLYHPPQHHANPHQVLSANPEIFARRDKGVYALAVLIPGYYKELDRKTALSLSNTTPTQGAQQGAPRQGPPKRKAPSAEEAAAAAAADAAAAAAAKETDPLAKATLLVEAAQQRVLQLKANVKQVIGDCVVCGWGGVCIVWMGWGGMYGVCVRVCIIHYCE